MSTEAAILIKNQVPQYIKGASDATIRGRLFLRILKEQGRIKYNHSGDRVIWNVLAREPQARTHSSGVGVTYAQFDAYEQLSLPVAGMTNQDALELKTQMLNKDPGVIVDLYGTKLDNLLRATANSLSRQVFLTNGGDNNKVVGLASPMIADGSVTADDMVAVPSSSATYGGKSVQLGNLGGTWTSTMSAATRPSTVTLNDWPYGSGSSQ